MSPEYLHYVDALITFDPRTITIWYSYDYSPMFSFSDFNKNI